jgi:quinol monooxygenase YgiN
MAGVGTRSDTKHQGAKMIAVIARLNVAAGKGPELEKAMLALASQVRANEPGNELYTLCKDAEGNYLVLELYRDEAALAAHGQSEHFKASGRSFKGLMAGAPQIQRLQVVG